MNEVNTKWYNGMVSYKLAYLLIHTVSRPVFHAWLRWLRGPLPPAQTISLHLTRRQMPSQARASEMPVMPRRRLRMPKGELLARIFAFCCSSCEWPEK